jgi:hypothetical protein
MNITRERIVDIFEALLIGKVKYIDIISKRSNKGIMYNSVYIHFDYWYDNIASRNLQDRIMNHPDKETRIVYDDPWYWIVLWNKSEKKNSNTPQQRINVKGLEQGLEQGFEPRNLLKEFKAENIDQDVKEVVAPVNKKPFAFVPRQVTIKKVEKVEKKICDSDYIKKLELENLMLKNMVNSLSNDLK